MQDRVVGTQICRTEQGISRPILGSALGQWRLVMRVRRCCKTLGPGPREESISQMPGAALH